MSTFNIADMENMGSATHPESVLRKGSKVFEFDTFEALSWAYELIKRFSIPRDRIFIGEEMVDENYKSYINKLFDQICKGEFEFYLCPLEFKATISMCPSKTKIGNYIT